MPLADAGYLRHRMINDLNGKIKVMELLSHESGDVKYQALLTVSVHFSFATCSQQLIVSLAS